MEGMGQRKEGKKRKEKKVQLQGLCWKPKMSLKKIRKTRKRKKKKKVKAAWVK